MQKRQYGIMRTLALFIFFVLEKSLLGQVPYEMIPVESSQKGQKEYIKVGNIKFSIENDPDFTSVFLKVNQKLQDDFEPIDTVSFSEYLSNIYAYKSSQHSDYIILWVTDYEFDSDINVFYYSDNELTKVGDLKILSACKNCDDLIYPIKSIAFIGDENSIQSKFLEALKLKVEETYIQDFQPNEISFTLNKKTREFKLHYR